MPTFHARWCSIDPCNCGADNPAPSPRRASAHTETCASRESALVACDCGMPAPPPVASPVPAPVATCAKHQWEPCSAWVGRYRCFNCHALGYRAVAGGRATWQAKHGEEIITYRCQYRRNKERCVANAVVLDGQRNGWCTTHQRKEQT